MTWLILLFILAIVLIFIEIFLIPGTTFVGIVGGILMILAVFQSYKILGNTGGNISLILSLLALIILIIFGAKSNLWSRFSNKSEIDGKANLVDEKIIIGTTGVTATVLKPLGKALINNKLIEVSTEGEYLDAGEKIEVIKINGAKIIIRKQV